MGREISRPPKVRRAEGAKAAQWGKAKARAPAEQPF